MKLSELYNKICGTIIGHSYGDALGAPHENKPFPPFSGKLDQKIQTFVGYTVSGVVGQVTDDTEMAFALLHTLLAGYTKDKAIMEYMNWINNIDCKPDCRGKAPFTGRNTKHLFETKGKSKPTVKFYNSQFNKKYHSEEERQQSQSTGCLMRSYPLAFVNNDAIAETDTRITNPSDIAVEAVKVYVYAVRMAILGYSKEQIKAEVAQKLTNPKLVEVYRKAVNNEFVNVTDNRSWLGYSFYCAFWALFNFDNYKDAIDAVICLSPDSGKKAYICDKSLTKKAYNELKKQRPKLVGDTDTNAAIAGALLGAYYGLISMCKDNNLKEDFRILIHADTRDGRIIQPLKYYPNWTNFKSISTDALILFLKSLRD
tara:strand:+ start:495 stop:1604 length:1110 start_codon:yes stop_codon:yes gene_type:complete